MALAEKLGDDRLRECRREDVRRVAHRGEAGTRSSGTTT
jgi:hypothetical protein